MDRLRQGWMVRQRLLLTVSLNRCLGKTLITIYKNSNSNSASTLHSLLDRGRLDTSYDFMTLFPLREHSRAGPALQRSSRGTRVLIFLSTWFESLFTATVFGSSLLLTTDCTVSHSAHRYPLSFSSFLWAMFGWTL